MILQEKCVNFKPITLELLIILFTINCSPLDRNTLIERSLAIILATLL